RVGDVSIVGKLSIAHIIPYKKHSLAAFVSASAKLCVPMNMIVSLRDQRQSFISLGRAGLQCSGVFMVVSTVDPGAQELQRSSQPPIPLQLLFTRIYSRYNHENTGTLKSGAFQGHE
ncbi:hypothetical protein SFRURICE_017808, partial [Spodoptera frugiperda]